jgi:hypothetical protein
MHYTQEQLHLNLIAFPVDKGDGFHVNTVLQPGTSRSSEEEDTFTVPCLAVLIEF